MHYSDFTIDLHETCKWSTSSSRYLQRQNCDKEFLEVPDDSTSLKCLKFKKAKPPAHFYELITLLGHKKIRKCPPLVLLPNRCWRHVCALSDETPQVPEDVCFNSLVFPSKTFWTKLPCCQKLCIRHPAPSWFWKIEILLNITMKV